MEPVREGRRAAALVALAALAAAIVILVLAAASKWRYVALAALALVATVVSGWYAVSRRGPPRLLAVLTGLAAVGILLASVVVAGVSWVRATIVLVLGGVSVGMSRIALARPVATDRATTGPTAVPPARHGVLLVNPRSGGGSAQRHHLADECRTRGIEVVVLRPGDDLVALAEQVVRRGADVIGMAGGDGSQALVATVAARHGLPYVVVPTGTRNHLARDLGLDLADVAGALDAFVEAVERRVDLATVNGRTFVNNASVGLYAAIVRTPGYREAKRRTAAAALPELVGPEARPLDLRFRRPDGTEQTTAQVVLVSNNPYRLHRFGERGRRSRIDGGVLGIVAARIASARELGRFLALESTGSLQRFPGWLEWTATEFRLHSSGPVDIALDGEALVLAPPLVFRTHPAALRLRLPRSATGHALRERAAHVASRSTVHELASVVAGTTREE